MLIYNVDDESTNSRIRKNIATYGFKIAMADGRLLTVEIFHSSSYARDL